MNFRIGVLSLCVAELFCGILILASRAPAQELEKDEISVSSVRILSSVWYAASEIPALPPNNIDCRYCLYRMGKASWLEKSPLERKDDESFVYQIKVQSQTDKEIVYLVWQYDFFNPLTNELLASHEFASRERIKPKRSKTLSVNSYAPPTATINAALLLRNKKQPYLEGATIKWVIFRSDSDKIGISK